MGRISGEGRKGPSERQLRVGETVRHALADVFTRGAIRDPDLEGRIITVPEVRMSPDLKLATAYVAALGEDDLNDLVTALNRNKKWLRGQVARRLTLKYAPDLRFRVDDRFDEAMRIDALLHSPEVARDLHPPGMPGRDDHDDAGGDA